MDYKEKLRLAKEALDSGSYDRDTIEYIFSELKESNSERIKEAAIAFIKASDHFYYHLGISKEEVIAWLEKQGEPFNDNIITRDDEILQAISIGLTDAKKDLGWSDFGGLPIEEIQEWLGKQGEQRPAKSIVEIWKDMRLEVYQQASGNRHEPNYSDDSTKMFSLNDIDEIIEKIGEQKPFDYENATIQQKDFAPKAGPNFKVGDWITIKQ